MYSKRRLLNEFYSTIDKTQLKVETKKHGIDYLGYLQNLAELQYGELRNWAFKYKLSGVTPQSFETLLDSHINNQINLCCYFDNDKNSLFAFNLDSYTENSEEVKTITQIVAGNLQKLGIRPLIIKSGHGYHIWCRISSSVENKKLQRFMNAMIDVAVFQMSVQKADATNLQCICYPRVNTNDVSIRLFGSRHIVTGNFSSVVDKIDEEDMLLSEDESWRYLEQYMNECTLKTAHFYEALDNAIALVSIIK